MSKDKEQLRADFLKQRRELSKKEIEKRSFQIRHHIQRLIRPQDRTLMFYVPIKNEVDLLSLVENLCEIGCNVLFPKLVEGRIVPYIVRSFFSDFGKGAYNIPEPDTHAYCGTIDIVFVPGIVFGFDGHRIGYGKGYFDQFLSTAGAGKTLGVAYQFQMLDELPHTDRDFRLDGIVTDEDFYPVKK